MSNHTSDPASSPLQTPVHNDLASHSSFDHEHQNISQILTKCAISPSLQCPSYPVKADSCDQSKNQHEISQKVYDLVAKTREMQQLQDQLLLLVTCGLGNDQSQSDQCDSIQNSSQHGTMKHDLSSNISENTDSSSTQSVLTAETQIKMQEGKIAELTRMNTDRDAEIKSLRAKLLDSEELRNSLKRTSQETTQQLGVLDQKVKEQEGTILALQEIITKKEIELQNSLKQQPQALQPAVSDDKSAKQISDLKKQLDQIRVLVGQKDKEISAIRSESFKYQLELQKLAKPQSAAPQQTQLQKDLDQVRQQLKSKETVYDILKTEYDRIKHTSEQQKSQLAKQQETLEQNKQELELQEKELRDNAARIDELSKQLLSHDGTAKSANTQAETLQSQLGAERARFEEQQAASQARLAGEARQVEELAAKHAALQAELAEAQEQATNAQTEMKKLRSEFQLTREEIEHKKTLITRRDAEIEAKKKELSQQQITIQNLSLEIKNLQDQLSTG